MLIPVRNRGLGDSQHPVIPAEGSGAAIAYDAAVPAVEGTTTVETIHVAEFFDLTVEVTDSAPVV